MNSKKTPFTTTANMGSSTTGLSFSSGITDDNFNRLLLQIEQQQKIIKNLEQQLIEKNAEVNSDFTKDDIKFMLMKCHPDKNINSKQAAKVTSKLLKLRDSK